ncbi:MAG: cobalt-precorrin 5A hydrolase [Pseudobutyrivibrio sp.]|nr:cobalt-precorrin 5A hydrolase [Pseudobutyrivibrio sp.]
MAISIISFTDRGNELAKFLKARLTEEDIRLVCKPEEGSASWVLEQFKEGRNLIFIGACGIAVRLIAPFVRDKLSDPAVIVMDEKGSFVIPILSGHVGGANELAQKLAGLLDATAVITTATDINGSFAVDLFAKKNGLLIVNKEGIAVVSAKVLRGEAITVCCEREIETGEAPECIGLVDYPPKEEVDVLISLMQDEKALLYLKPKSYVLGMGCKKGIGCEELEEFAAEELEKLGISFWEISKIASLDLKKNEPGLKELASKHRLTFETFSKEKLMSLEGDFSSSDFVENTVGVDNVCERSALAACEGQGEIVLRKQARDGMTLAVARRKVKLGWD